MCAQANLLDLTGAQDVIVVVSRWFGGVLLGPNRFKYIAMIARAQLEAAGFLAADKVKAKGKGKRR